VIILFCILGRLQPVPGYMDAEYYYAGAIRLHEGYGFTQPFLWNYLDEPAGLPHPRIPIGCRWHLDWARRGMRLRFE
jgi:hypothetical protein